jgi:hypothetical protein
MLHEEHIKRRPGALTNLPHCGKVVSTKMGCGRFDGKCSRVVAPALAQEGSMTTLISNHEGLITRRSIIISAAASLVCAPAIVRAASLMPVRRLRVRIAFQYAGFCERLMYQSLDSNLRADEMSTVLNGEIVPENNARRMVAYARVQGWLAPEATS